MDIIIEVWQYLYVYCVTSQRPWLSKWTCWHSLQADSITHTLLCWRIESGEQPGCISTATGAFEYHRHVRSVRLLESVDPCRRRWRLERRLSAEDQRDDAKHVPRAVERQHVVLHDGMHSRCARVCVTSRALWPRTLKKWKKKQQLLELLQKLIVEYCYCSCAKIRDPCYGHVMTSSLWCCQDWCSVTTWWWNRKRCRRSSSGSLAFCRPTKTWCRSYPGSYQTRVHCVLVADVRACACNVLVHCVVYRVARAYTVVYQAVTYSNTGLVRLFGHISPMPHWRHRPPQQRYQCVAFQRVVQGVQNN